jgi:hypothetical protein
MTFPHIQTRYRGSGGEIVKISKVSFVGFYWFNASMFLCINSFFYISVLLLSIVTIHLLLIRYLLVSVLSTLQGINLFTLSDDSMMQVPLPLLERWRKQAERLQNLPKVIQPAMVELRVLPGSPMFMTTAHCCQSLFSIFASKDFLKWYFQSLQTAKHKVCQSA